MTKDLKTAIGLEAMYQTLVGRGMRETRREWLKVAARVARDMLKSGEIWVAADGSWHSRREMFGGR